MDVWQWAPQRSDFCRKKIDPSTRAFLGNYPQGFSHIGVIASEVNMARWLRKEEQMG